MMSLAKVKNSFPIFPLLLVFYEITNYLANDMYLPALPQIMIDLNASVHATQQTLTVFFLGTASLQLFLGPLSDRFGRRPILFVGGIVFLLSTLFCLLSTNIYALIVARFFQGAAICSIVTAGYSAIHELYEHTRAIQILAIMASVTVLAPAFGPLLGSAVLHWLSWRWIFGLLFVWALIALLMLWFWMPESNPKEKQHPLDWKNIFYNYRIVLQNGTFMRNTLIWCFTFLGMIAWIAGGPFLVISKLHFSTWIFGICQVMIFGSLILGAQFVNRRIKKTGADKLIRLGLIITLLSGILAFSITFFFPHFLFGLIISLMVFTFGAEVTFSPSHRVAIEACHAPMGTRMAIFSTLMSLFGFIGGLLVSVTYTATLLWFGVLLLVLGCIACLIRVTDKTKSLMST